MAVTPLDTGDSTRRDQHGAAMTPTVAATPKTNEFCGVWATLRRGAKNVGAEIALLTHVAQCAAD